MFDVSGNVTVDSGKVLADGEILFEPEPTAQHAWGPDHARIKDGEFKLKVKEGKHKVRIIADAPIPGTKDMYGKPLTKNYIDVKFNTETTLSADVGVGKTTFTFEVTSMKESP
jgi:hypothetical protein